MRLVARVGLTLALVSIAACGGKQTKPAGAPGAGAEGESLAAGETVPGTEGAALAAAYEKREVPASPQPMPDTVVAIIALDNPNAQLEAIRQAVAQIEPGLAGMVHAGFLDQGLAELTSAQRISGLDYGKPLRVLILDPMTVNPPALIVAGVADEGALREAVGDGPTEIQVHQGVAVMGSAAALDAAFGYAVTTLLGEPLPAKPTATVYMGTFLSKHQAQIEAMMPMAKAGIAQSMPPDEAAQAVAAIEGFVDFVMQVDLLKLALDASAASVTVNLAAVPKDQSGMAAFIAKQKPSSFAQLANVEPGMFVMAGRMDWKELYEKMMSFAGTAYGQLYGDQAEAMLGMQKAWAEIMGEEFAMTGGYDPNDGLWMGGTWEISDAKKVNNILDKYFKKLPKKVGQKGAEMNLKYRRNAMKHRGVALSEMTFSMAKGSAPEAVAAIEQIFGKGGMKVLFGAFAQTSVMAMGKDAGARAKASIDVGKGNQKAFPIPAGLESALAHARQLQESMVFALDLPPVLAVVQGAPAVAPGSAGEPAVFAVGFAGGSLGARLTVPLSQVKAVMQAGAP